MNPGVSGSGGSGRFNPFTETICGSRQGEGGVLGASAGSRTRGFHRIRILERKPRARLVYRGPLDPTAGRRVKAK